MTKLEVVVADRLTRRLQTGMPRSAEGIAAMLAPTVLEGLERAAFHAYQVHSTVVDAVWEGATAMARREKGASL